MARPITVFQNESVQEWLECLALNGQRVGGHGENSLPAAIDDVIIGTCWLDAEGLVGQPKLSPSKLFKILSYLPIISAPAIKELFGKPRKGTILGKQGIGTRQAQNYLGAAMIASSEIKKYMEQHPAKVEEALINAPIYKEDIHK